MQFCISRWQDNYPISICPTASISFGVMFCFCLRPSAKDQRITWVAVVLLVLLVVLHLLVHFLIKSNLREKKFSPARTSRSTVWHSTNWTKEKKEKISPRPRFEPGILPSEIKRSTTQLSCRNLVGRWKFLLYCRRPRISIGRHLLVIKMWELCSLSSFTSLTKLILASYVSSNAIEHFRK